MREFAPRAQKLSFEDLGSEFELNGETVRLIELGEAEYLASIPGGDAAHGTIYDGLFDRLDQVNEQRGRPWRDVHDIWQW